jgi:peptide/nickel transport system ATP-binding protein
VNETLLSVEGLRTRLDSPHGPTHCIDGVDLALRKGECLALVGESGCGKSMTALAVMRLLPDAAKIAGGRVLLDGRDLLALPEAAMRAVRGRRVSMIFQEPATSLNPVLTIGRQVIEVIERHTGLRGAAAEKRALELLEDVGIPDGARRLHEYPFQLSGGLKQRAMIAAALAAEPEVLIADEPTTALDVTIQAQILELLAKLRAEHGTAMLLITHDLGVVWQAADRVAVMYAGEIVETATRNEFFRAPQHPYSQKLFEALPSPQRRGRGLAIIPGQVPPITAEFRGCRFAERCDYAFERCRKEEPRLIELPNGHQARCHLRERGPEAPRQAPAGSVAVASAALAPAQVLLEVRDLKVHFPIRHGPLRRVIGYVRAVDGVSLTIHEGRTLALVGESGCGKTTAGKALLQLIPPTGGSVAARGVELTRLSRAELRAYRARMQIIFQDPYASLDPRMRVVDAGRRRARAARGRIARAGRAARTRAGALPARVLRWPASEDRHRARARGAPAAHRVRRADERARRLGAGADPEPARLLAGSARAGVPVHHAQPGGGRVPGARGGGDVPRTHRRARHGRGGARRPEAPLHAGAALGCSGHRRRQTADPAGRGAAFARPSAHRLPFPAALPARARRVHARLPGDGPAIVDARGCVCALSGRLKVLKPLLGNII